MLQGQIALVTAHDIYLYSLNGHPIAHVSLADSLSAFNFTQPSSETEDAREEYTGGLTFLNREFLKYGSLFVVGVGSQLALYRCVPGVQLFDDELVKPWTLEEQGRLHRSDDHEGGDCTMVKFIGYAVLQCGGSRAALIQAVKRYTPHSAPNLAVMPSMRSTSGPCQKATRDTYRKWYPDRA